MKHLFILFFAFTFQLNLLANVSDSLQGVLMSAESESEKFDILTQLGEAYLLEMNFEKAENSAFQILELSKTKEIQYSATAYHLLGRIYLRNGETDKGDSIYLVSIKSLKEGNKVDQEKLAWQLYNYGNFLKNVGNYEKAITSFDESYLIQKKLGDKGKQGDCLLNSGAMYLYLGKNDEAEDLLNKAYIIALEEQDTSSLNTITTNMASVYEIKGDYPEALYQLELSEKYAATAFDLAYIYGNRGNLYFYLGKIDSSIYAYQKSSTYFIESGRMLENGMVLMELGVIFKSQKKYDQAFKMFKKSEKVFKDADNNDLLTAVLINKGDAFKELNQADSAIYNYKIALTYAVETNNNNYLGICNQAISLLLMENKELNKALIYMNKALTYFLEMGDERLLAEAYNSLTDIYIQLENYSLADKFLNKALKIIHSLGHIKLKINTYDNYIQLNALRLNAPEIYHYHSEQIRLLDSLKSETNSKIVEDLSAQYHLQETEDSLRIIHLDLARQEAISSVKQKQLTYSIVGLILFSILLIFVYLSRKKVKEKSAENELLLGEIHHRVKNNLQVISSLLSLQERNISDKTAKAAILEGKERVQSMGLIHKLLYQKNNFAGIDMNDYVQKLVDGLLDSFGISKEEMELDIDFSKINLDVDTAVPIGLMINELVINSLKYAFEGTNKPKLTVKIEEQNKQLILQVEDNGNGEVASILTSKSFGMKLIRSLSRQVSGVLEIEKHIGLCFKISINDYKTIR